MCNSLKPIFLLLTALAGSLAFGFWIEDRIRIVNLDSPPNPTSSTTDAAAVERPAESHAYWQSYIESSRLASAVAFVWILALQCIVGYLVLSKIINRHAASLANAQDESLRRHRDLIRTRDAVIFGLAKLAESRDADTGQHLERISLYSTQLAAELRRDPKFHDQITPAFLQTIGISSALHDIGKVGTEDAILLKPGKLTNAERSRMQSHAIVGGECLRQIEQRLANSNFLQMAREIALYHHERWDGTGYPSGLSGEEIPLAARIVSIADVYDALSVERVYKESIPHEKCVEMICAEAGQQFDPDLVEAFRRIESQFAAIANQFAERTRDDDDADTESSDDASFGNFMQISPEAIEELQSRQALEIEDSEQAIAPVTTESYH